MKLEQTKFIEQAAKDTFVKIKVVEVSINRYGVAIDGKVYRDYVNAMKKLTDIYLKASL